jgi:hypothetical protein
MADPISSPPPQRFRWDWLEFAFAAMANALGTLLAGAVVYLGGVVTGYWQADPYSVLAAALLLLLPVLYGVFRVLYSRWVEPDSGAGSHDGPPG